MARVLHFEPGKKEGTIKTPTCRLIYPSLFEPTNMKGQTSDADPNKLKYRLSLLVPKDAVLDFLKKSLETIINGQAEKDRKVARLPVLKTAEVNSLAKYADEFPILLRATSKFQPDVIGPSTNKVQEDEAYSGRWGRAVLNPYWYPSIDGGKPGIALGLNSVQFLDHAEPIGGSRVAASDDFDPVEGEEESPLGNMLG